jgi:gliding motility-associated-like protein
MAFRNSLKNVFFPLVLLFFFKVGLGQDLSNKGKEFWLGYGLNYSFFNEPPVNGQELQVYISTEQAANVTVSISSTTWTKTIAIPANTVDYSVVIPKAGVDDARIVQEGLSKKGISIKSDVPVTVYAHQYNTQVSGATMLMPLETYGYSYYSVNYAQNMSGAVAPDLTPSVANGPDWFSWFFVVAPEDDTRLIITPADSTQGGWLPGQSYTVDLDKGEIYNVMGKLKSNSGPPYTASKDLTGSKIVSVSGPDGKCHPIAVFSGSSGIRLCRGDGGEYMGQQIFPSRAWGTRYLTYHMINNTSTDVAAPFLNFYRICVMDPTTQVKKNGVTMTGLKNNFYYEFSSTSGDYIESDKPILVAQYTPNANQCATMNLISYGDPEMIYLSPIEQGQKSVLFYTPRKSFIDYIYASIYLPTSALSSLRVDGNPVPASNSTPHPALPGYSVAIARFTGPAAQHAISCDTSFNAYVYGLGLFESYGFTAGTLVNDLNSYSSIRNKYSLQPVSDSFTCAGTPFRAKIRVAYKLTGIHWKLSQVPGLDISADSVIANPVPEDVTRINGRTYYTYSLKRDLVFRTSGTFQVPVTYMAPDIDQCDQKEDAFVKVIVKEGPQADFISAGQFCLMDTVELRGNSIIRDYQIAGYSWTFQDNSQQSTKDAKKKFASPGLQPVRYEIFMTNGCSHDTTKQVNIQSTASVMASVTGRSCADSILQFTSSIGTGNAGNVWYWSFGDGKSDSSRTSNIISHTYAAKGKDIIVKHWVLSVTGCSSDTNSLTIPFIHENPVGPALGLFSDSLCPGSLVTFTAAAVPGITEWSWDLGNGTFSNAPSPVTARYGSSGNYTAKLRIRDANGCGSSASTRDLTIDKVPVVSAGPDKYTTAGGSVKLEGSVSGTGQYDLRWNPDIFLNDVTVPTPLCSPSADTIYVLRAVNRISLCTSSDSVKVVVLKEFIIPNTFTPNNDGINDKWEILSLNRYPDCIVEVYNTHGRIIHRSVGYALPWDGKYRGNDLPVGTYYYVIDPRSGEKPKSGYVTILR